MPIKFRFKLKPRSASKFYVILPAIATCQKVFTRKKHIEKVLVCDCVVHTWFLSPCSFRLDEGVYQLVNSQIITTALKLITCLHTGIHHQQ